MLYRKHKGETVVTAKKTNNSKTSGKAQPERTKRAWPLAALGVAAILLLVGALMIVTYRESNKKQCEQTATTVRLSEDATEQYNVAGELCYKGSLGKKTVQLLVSGHTYDSTYWDFEHEPETYSYVDAAIDDGYATFNIDRLGVGKSDVPADPASLTTPSQAYVVHQLVEALRAGEIVDTKVEKIVLVGHSLGSAIVEYAAAAYGNVQAVVATDGLSDRDMNFIPILTSNFYPANQDPKFADQNIPDGYITTKPGKRGLNFYNTEYADPAVIDADEATKQPGTAQAIATIAAVRTSGLAENLRLPVFMPVGEKDALYCDENQVGLSCATPEAIVDREKKYFPNACIEAYIQPNAGHDGVLHPNAPDMFKAVSDWIDAWVGKTAKDNPTKSC